MNDSGIVVERLWVGDEPAMLAINQLLAEAFEDAESYSHNPPDETYLARLLASREFVALTATVEGTLVGGLIAYELRKFEQARSEFYIYDLAVLESHRRSGVATALVETLQRLAATKGGWVIYVQADYGDDPAIALYTKLGRRTDVMHFDIDVS